MKNNFKQKIAHSSVWALLLCGCQLSAQTISGSVLTTISGNVQTEAGNNVENVTVTLNGPGGPFFDLTDSNGDFSFSGLADNQTYSLCLSKNDNPLNGVTTFDGALLAKHINGTQPLNSPYKIIAAETAPESLLPSATLNVLDLYFMRLLILGVITDLPAPSWKFVPADAVLSPVWPFPDIPLPAGCKTINLNGSAAGQDFIGIKTADVNGSAVSGS
jgi:hypothetical protein